MMQQQRYPPLPIMEADGSWREASTQCHVAPNCPRCASTNTKFCYYNNYSLAQPRYFCKACRRYWTKGGSLRNVPVGGGCRKNRRSRSRAHRNSPHNNSTAPDNSSSSSSGQSSGPEIDMAAVFARYVSQDVAAGPKQDTCRLSDQAAWQEGSYDDLESFDYEMLVTDDVFWSTPSEAMAPLEELDSSPLFSSPSANDLLVSDANWSCPDLAGYGDFYTP